MAKNQHATTEELLEAVFSVVRNGSVNTHLQQQFNYNNRRAVFSMWSMPRGYKWDEV
jgi:hypothetical protein